MEFSLLLREHNIKLPPSRATAGAKGADFLRLTIFLAGIMPKARKVYAQANMPLPEHQQQVRAVSGGPFYYEQIFRDMAKRVRPIRSLFEQGIKFVVTPSMEAIV